MPSIIQALHNFESSGWVISGYLVTYTSSLVILAKFSDVTGRRFMLICSNMFFAVFSGGCGAAHTMTQLIVCRVFQGFGAAGSIAICVLTIYEMVPPSRYPLYGALVSVANMTGSLTGPIIGGVLSDRASWRWVFLINVPATVAVTLLFYFSTPEYFPHQWKPHEDLPRFRDLIMKESLSRIDLIGCFLLLSASILLVTVLLQSGTSFGWSSPVAIILLILSILIFLVFLSVERKKTTKTSNHQEPIFPWRFLKNRVWMGVLFASLFAGIPYNTLMIALPQQFQYLNFSTPYQAGICLIPFNAMISFGGIIISFMAGKLRISTSYLFLLAIMVQLSGLGASAFLTTPKGEGVPGWVYGLNVLIGLGVGMTIGITVLLPPRLVEIRDLGTATGALFQFRLFGGALGVAIESNILNAHLNSSTASFDRVSHSPEHTIDMVAAGFSIMYKTLFGFAIAQLIAVLLGWDRELVIVSANNGSGSEKAG